MNQAKPYMNGMLNQNYRRTRKKSELEQNQNFKF